MHVTKINPASQHKRTIATTQSKIVTALVMMIPLLAISAAPGISMKTEKKMDKAANAADTVYKFEATGLDGKNVDLSQYRGEVLLIVNTASRCGFTPQYKQLEQLHEKYEGKGLSILGFPCNQFGQQEPGDNEAIGSFCQKNYGVKFKMFSKIDVNGKSEHPLYKFLKEKAPGVLGSEAIKWNFTKFLVDRSGHVVKRYAPDVNPLDISPEIEKLLAAAPNG